MRDDEELLIQISVPHSVIMIEDGKKSTRKLWVNFIMNLFYRDYNNVHREWNSKVRKLLKPYLKKKPFNHIEGSKYTVTSGFFSGKSTNLDIDGMFYLNKWFADLIIKMSDIPDDNIKHFTDSNCKYLGPSDKNEEVVLMQFTRYNVGDEPIAPAEPISKLHKKIKLTKTYK